MSNGEKMNFPNSIWEFLFDYSFIDEEQVYTNGISLIPTFRVKQAIEHYYEDKESEEMTAEEIIADERYHTCGRCRWGDLSEDFYPCIECNHSFDRRKDYWEYAESDKEGENNDIR